MQLPRRIRTRADDRGTALVEFAFVGVIFFVLLFGIIAMSVLLALKQNMTQAASEAARASIAVVDDPGTTTEDERVTVAESALSAVVGEFDVECNGVQAKCKAVVHECGADTSNVLLMTSQPAAVDPCLTTFVEFDNTGNNRVLPPFPIISGLEPDTFSSQSTVRLVPVPTV